MREGRIIYLDEKRIQYPDINRMKYFHSNNSSGYNPGNISGLNPGNNNYLDKSVLIRPELEQSTVQDAPYRALLWCGACCNPH